MNRKEQKMIKTIKQIINRIISRNCHINIKDILYDFNKNLLLIYCVCDDWKNNIKNTTGIADIIMTHNFKFYGKVKYCSWCGRRLKKND